MTSQERREGRYQRRKAKRQARKQARSDALGPTGKIKVNGSRDGIKRARRKLKLFHREFKAGKRDFKDIEQYMECQAAYYRNFNDHGRILRLRRLYYAIFFGGASKCSESQKAG